MSEEDAMNDMRRRVVGYGLTALVTGGLVYAGFVYEADADPKTLLSSVDIQVRLATGMPERDAEGQLLETRVRLLEDARKNLDLVEAQLPSYAPAREYRAYLSYLAGEYRDAAAHYREARGLEECAPDLWDSMLINEARMLRMAGDLDRALQVLRAERSDLQAKNRSTADMHEARILAGLKRIDEAVELANRVRQLGAEDPIRTLEAGWLLESMLQPEDAEAAYLAVGEDHSSGTYYRARLKIRAGDVDRGLRLLELAVSAAPSEVRRLVDRDSSDWKGVADTKRFRDLVGPERPASTPGR